MPWKTLIIVLLIAPVVLSADAVVSVGYSFGSSFPEACDTTPAAVPPGTTLEAVSSGPSSETLTVRSCNPAASTNPAAWVSASAKPFSVALAGEPGYIPATDTSITISASAEWDGELEAIGGSGSAVIDFQLAAPGDYEEFGCSFSIPSLGIVDECPVGPSVSNDLSFAIPVTFNDPIAYMLSARQSVGFFDSNSEDAALDMINFSVMDASGAPIPGASVAEAPEPAAILLLGVAALLALPSLSRRLKARASA